MEQIEQRKEKAAELSSGRHANTDYAPKLTPYERKKQCSLCGVLVGCHCQNTEDIIHYRSLLSYENTLSLFLKTLTEASAKYRELLSRFSCEASSAESCQHRGVEVPGAGAQLLAWTHPCCGNPSMLGARGGRRLLCRGLSLDTRGSGVLFRPAHWPAF